MTNDELKIKLSEILPAITFEDGGQSTTIGWLNISVGPKDLHAFAKSLKQHPELSFDYLFCETCVDWKTHLTMVYHLESTQHRHIIVIKSKLDRNKPEVETVSDIWKTAEFHEREVYELFGVSFLNHPDLRLLILPDGWEGRNPLRKDFEDPVNMVKL
jgi:NADH:ubiquinone oxidoreductase subunit C